MNRRGRLAVVVLLAGALVSAGCAARRAYRQGNKEAKKQNWDLAVARYTKALEQDPENIPYRIALDKARVEASRLHLKQSQKHLAAEELEQAVEELEIASRYDPSNAGAVEQLRIARERIRKRDDEKRRQAEFEAMKTRALAARVPVPVLSPRSQNPIALKWSNDSLEKLFEALGKLSGVNVLFDEGFRDKRVSVNLQGVTFQEALEQLTFVNRLFYKVLDQNTLILVPESPQKRRAYEDNLIQTFYLQNADVNETVALITRIMGTGVKAAGNPSLGAITAAGSPDELAMVARILESNDKPKGEVLVEVRILEVNRTALRRYGIELSNYEANVTLSPTGASGEVAGGFTSIRAHLLSSLNLADWVVSIPSTLFARFLQTDANVRILASPRLRAAEGKKTELKIGTEVPIPVTTFTATQAGTSTFAPATSFQYRNVGVTLGLTPKVNASGEVSLELLAEFSLLGEDRNVGTGNNPIIVPTFLSRNVNGVLRVRDGETSLIGGLLSSRETDSLRGAFGLQSVPILNKIFSSSQKQSEQQEILISLTPYVVRGPRLTEDDLKSTFVGTEEVVRVPGARPALFGPEPSPSPSAAPAPPTPAPATPSPPPTPTPPPPAAAPATETPVSALLRPAELSLREGEAAAVDVVVLGAREVTAVELTLAFEGGVVQALEAAPGSLLTLDGASVGAERRLEAGGARLRFTRPARRRAPAPSRRCACGAHARARRPSRSSP